MAQNFFGLEYGWNLVIVLALTLAIFIYLKYSKQGYEIAVVGESENTARYAGINVKKVIIRTMALSGAICGIAGFHHCQRRQPYHFHQHGWRQGIYGHHRIMAQQVQCVCHGSGLIFPGIHAEGAGGRLPPSLT
ncbi:MAG: ABC transporter permease subunit [Enterocloster clostridioformis]